MKKKVLAALLAALITVSATGCEVVQSNQQELGMITVLVSDIEIETGVITFKTIHGDEFTQITTTPNDFTIGEVVDIEICNIYIPSKENE